jgi:two-component system sensor histidine kinase/response regulator
MMEMSSTRVPRTFLLAEQDAATRLIIQSVLERAGHRVLVVGTGRAAVEMLRQQPCEAVLMSARLPELDGIEATRLIRAEEAGRGGRIPIYALTSQDDPEDEPRCLEAGMDGCLRKPVRSAALLELISQLPGRSPPAAASPSPTAEAFDPARLLTLAGGEEALVKVVVDLFLSDTPSLWSSLEEAAEQGNTDALARAAHKLKGSLLNMAAGPASAAARELEVLAREGRLEEARQGVSTLRAELARLRKALEGLP